MTLGEMRSLIASEDLRLTKSLGQNFLHDGNQVRRIIALSGVTPGDHVLEVGPGLGPLTEELLAQGARVIAVEKDQRLAQLVQKRLGHHPSLTIHHADAMDWLRDTPELPPGTRLVANLPYSVGSAILVELASRADPPRSLTATLQTEVVGRVRAQAGTEEYGVLTLLLGRVYTVAGAFRIPASCFFPAPKIESSCVHLLRRDRPLLEGTDAEAFVRLVKLAFSQRRKQLRKTLRGVWPEEFLAGVWRQLDLREDVRAETLPLERLADLARLLPALATPTGF
ncbi:MAG: ribosomal RNA small subunit methyltransferase A [Verrucomicrobiales bacterium]|nr:ribosomal RNA small subunit methyltransferase A [Verrucomicrobiales bacterium]